MNEVETLGEMFEALGDDHGRKSMSEKVGVSVVWMICSREVSWAAKRASLSPVKDVDHGLLTQDYALP